MRKKSLIITLFPFIIILPIWTIYCFSGISKNMNKYGALDWIIVIIIFLIPYIIFSVILIASLKKFQKQKNNTPNNTGVLNINQNFPPEIIKENISSFKSSSSNTNSQYQRPINLQTLMQSQPNFYTQQPQLNAKNIENETVKQAKEEADRILEEAKHQGNSIIASAMQNANDIAITKNAEFLDEKEKVSTSSSNDNKKQSVFSDEDYLNKGAPLWTLSNDSDNKTPNHKEISQNIGILNTIPNIYQNMDDLYVYDVAGNCIGRKDGKPLADDDCAYLMQQSYKQIVQKEATLTCRKRLSEEEREELSVQFMMSEHKEFDRLINEFEEYYQQSSKSNTIDEKIKLLENAAATFKMAKKCAYSTKGGKIFFQDMYEHLYNSRNKDFSYIDIIKEQLESLIKDRDYTIPTLKNVISEHSGIMQKDVYQYMPDTPKSEIQRYIRQFEEEGTIKRTKKGSSYVLELL